MYIVTAVKLFDNHTITTEVPASVEDARELRREKLDQFMDLYPEIDFNVIGSRLSEVQTVVSDDDKKPWLIVKITKIDA